MGEYRIALSSDFVKADGSSTFPMFDLGPLGTEPGVAFEYLKSAGEVRADELEGFDALILLGHEFTRASVPSGGRLAIVARFGVGYDTVDVAACSDNDIALTITPDGVRRPVAVSIIALILAVTGKLLIKDRLTRQGPEGFAKKAQHMGVGLVDKTLGSIGIGNIGAEMYRLAKPFDMKFMAHDPYADPAVAEALGVRMVDLETLFREADILCVNCPLGDETHHIVSAERIAMMKPSAFIINTSRGPTIDQKALTQALQEGRIAGAGLDVLEQEPPDADDPILRLDNVVLNPHALCWTDQCFAGIGATAIKATFEVMRGREPRGIVNREILENAAWRQKLEAFRGAFGE